MESRPSHLPEPVSYKRRRLRPHSAKNIAREQLRWLGLHLVTLPRPRAECSGFGRARPQPKQHGINPGHLRTPRGHPASRPRLSGTLGAVSVHVQWRSGVARDTFGRTDSDPSDEVLAWPGHSHQQRPVTQCNARFEYLPVVQNTGSTGFFWRLAGKVDGKGCRRGRRTRAARWNAEKRARAVPLLSGPPPCPPHPRRCRSCRSQRRFSSRCRHRRPPCRRRRRRRLPSTSATSGHMAAAARRPPPPPPLLGEATLPAPARVRSVVRFFKSYRAAPGPRPVHARPAPAFACTPPPGLSISSGVAQWGGIRGVRVRVHSFPGCPPPSLVEKIPRYSLGIPWESPVLSRSPGKYFPVSRGGPEGAVYPPNPPGYTGPRVHGHVKGWPE
eukprot:gene13842-biopygen9599